MSDCYNYHPIRDYAAAIAELVFSPDYYNGPWEVIFRNGKRKCRNHATADAWVKYIRRNYSDGWTATIGKVL